MVQNNLHFYLVVGRALAALNTEPQLKTLHLLAINLTIVKI